MTKPFFGSLDASYQAAGQLTGLIKLADDFYEAMATVPEAKIIRDMHPEDLTESRQKLAYFLSGWLGGPKVYRQHYGSIHLPSAHSDLAIGFAERDMWIYCMKLAVDQQPYNDDFKHYLIEQLKVPAERVRAVSRGASPNPS